MLDPNASYQYQVNSYNEGKKSEPMQQNSNMKQVQKQGYIDG